MLLRSAISENKLFEQLWRGAGVAANQWPPCSAAEGTAGGLKVPGIAQPAGRVGAVVLVTLMRFLSLRLMPKAAAAPKRGRGPGTDDAGGWSGVNVTVPTISGRQKIPRRHPISATPPPKDTPKGSTPKGSNSPIQTAEETVNPADPPEETVNPEQGPVGKEQGPTETRKGLRALGAQRSRSPAVVSHLYNATISTITGIITFFQARDQALNTSKREGEVES